MAQKAEKQTVEQDIERFRAIIERDPSSTVFASLAESLRRGGFLDEAITVCVEGLQRHPNHISGKVALGRIYYDKDMIGEAKKEFEDVVRLAPDNILASRLLNEIKDSQEIKNSQRVEGPESRVKDENTRLTTRDHFKKEVVYPVSKEDAGLESKTAAEFSNEVYTVTIAELFERQGHLDKALKAYEEVLKRDAADTAARDGADRIKSMKEKSLSEKKDAKEDERLTQLANWASKFKRGGR